MVIDPSPVVVQLYGNPPNEAGRARPAAGSCGFLTGREEAAEISQGFKFASLTVSPAVRGARRQPTRMELIEVTKETMDVHLNSVDLALCETEGILDVLIFIRIEAEPATHQRLNDACVTLLHLAIERLQKASGKLGEIRAAA